MRFTYKKILLIALLVFMAIAERLWFDLGSNVELVTLATFVTAFYIHRRVAIFVALFLLALTDVIKGNTSIAIFTWSAFVVTSLLAIVLSTRKTSLPTKALAFVGGGLGSSVFFFVWTNFGVWYLDRWGMYSDTIGGLWHSYVMGIPFFKVHFLSNIIILSSVFILVETYKYLSQIKLVNILKLSGTR